MARGFFLVFEGPEGSGKSTQIARLEERFREAGYEPVVTREPGGTPAGEAIRKVILDPGLTMNAMTEFLLYAASRAQHVGEVIRPALHQGRLVICDRFTAASLAYQGYGRGVNLDFIASLNQTVTGGLEPDLAILLDIEVERGLARVAERGESDRLERADIDFHRRVREGFLEEARGKPNWLIINAEQGEEALAEAIWQAIRQHILG